MMGRSRELDWSHEYNFFKDTGPRKMGEPWLFAGINKKVLRSYYFYGIYKIYFAFCEDGWSEKKMDFHEQVSTLLHLTLVLSNNYSNQSNTYTKQQVTEGTNISFQITHLAGWDWSCAFVVFFQSNP